MRFAPESTDGANAGLNIARDFLEPVKAAHPWITYADLWTLVRSVRVALIVLSGEQLRIYAAWREFGLSYIFCANIQKDCEDE